MAFGDVVKWEKETADNTVPVGAALHHAVPPFPFDVRLHMPIVPTSELAPVDERGRDREEIKQQLRGIMRNRFFSETARVAAARELARVVDNEEIAELRAEVARMRAIIEANTPNEQDLPPHLRRKR